ARVRCYAASCGSLVVDSFFFFQAEDGIRDDLVTGVQTCALPIYSRGGGSPELRSRRRARRRDRSSGDPPPRLSPLRLRETRGVRSEERRVGREWRGQWATSL